MNSKRKPIPQFSTEDEEREFWATHDSTDYIDWNKAQKIPPFLVLSNLSKQQTKVQILDKFTKLGYNMATRNAA